MVRTVDLQVDSLVVLCFWASYSCVPVPTNIEIWHWSKDGDTLWMGR